MWCCIDMGSRELQVPGLQGADCANQGSGIILLDKSSGGIPKSKKAQRDVFSQMWFWQHFLPACWGGFDPLRYSFMGYTLGDNFQYDATTYPYAGFRTKMSLVGVSTSLDKWVNFSIFWEVELRKTNGVKPFVSRTFGCFQAAWKRLNSPLTETRALTLLLAQMSLVFV